MRFFVPKVLDADVDRAYAKLAGLCGAPLPARAERVRSISFEHDAENWRATVGERLRGSKTVRRRVKGGVLNVTTRLSDNATVLAIFVGHPCKVVTDAHPIGAVASAWDNPFAAGEALTIEFFEP